jgi:2,5-diketo-D-gluconate reductase B
MEHLEIRGSNVPRLGFGTWELNGAECRAAVSHALELGYRHLDTAQMYGNEEEVGEAIAGSGLGRDEIFLTTKVWPSQARRGDVERSTEESLRKLRTDHVDLLLLHWPVDDVPLAETLGAMSGLVDVGKARHIGVSNFPPSLVARAAELAPILTNQVEYHPYLAQTTLLQAAEKHDHMLAAYAPIARGQVIDDPVLTAIGEGYGKSAVQVTLRWFMQQPRVAAIPRSASARNREANLDIFDFSLTEAEMEQIHGLARGGRIVDLFGVDWED